MGLLRLGTKDEAIIDANHSDMQLMNLGIAQYDNYSREMFEFEYDVSVRVRY